MTTVAVKEWMAVGKKLFRQRNYQQAEDFLRRVVRHNPRYADVQNMLGVIHHAQGRFSDAIAAFERALEINPNYTEALLNLAVLFNDLGQYKEAKKLYERLRKSPTGKTAKPSTPAGLGKSPEDIEPVLRGKLSNLHAETGDIYLGLGLYPHAISEYERALALNPSYTDIITKMGIAQRESGAVDASIKTLQGACKLNGKYLQAKIQLGVSLYTAGKEKEARKTWQEILKTDPDNPSAQMYLSLCE